MYSISACVARFVVSWRLPSSPSPSFLYQFLRAKCARACICVCMCICVYVSVCVCERAGDIGRRRRVNLIVGFWVSASRRHRARYDDEVRGKDGEETHGIERREGEEGWRKATGKGVPDKTTGAPTPVADHPHEIRHCHSTTTSSPPGETRVRVWPDMTCDTLMLLLAVIFYVINSIPYIFLIHIQLVIRNHKMVCFSHFN